jgi:hypothetical protein
METATAIAAVIHIPRLERRPGTAARNALGVVIEGLASPGRCCDPRLLGGLPGLRANVIASSA